MTKYWMQKAFKGHKKGSLHRQLDIPQDKRIPTKKLVKIKNTPVGGHIGKK